MGGRTLFQVSEEEVRRRAMEIPCGQGSDQDDLLEFSCLQMEILHFGL